MDNISLLVSVRIPVPVEKVYHAWTDAKALKKWFAEDSDERKGSLELDHRVGGHYRATIRVLNETFSISGEYKEVIPNKKIVYTQQWEDGLGFSTLVTVEFREKDFGTELIVTQDGITSEDEAEGHKSGWDIALARLAQKLTDGEI